LPIPIKNQALESAKKVVLVISYQLSCNDTQLVTVFARSPKISKRPKR